MSAEEMRSFCLSIKPYNLRVQVRLKNGAEVFFGKIGVVDQERFQLLTDDDDIKSLRYTWVARIKSA